MEAVMHNLIVECARDVTEKEKGRLSVNEKNFEKMLVFGTGVDVLAMTTEVYHVCASIRTGTRAGMVAFEVDDLIFNCGASNPFFAAMQGVNSIAFTKSKTGDRLLVTATVEEVLEPA